MKRQQLCIPISQFFALTECTIKLSIKIQILINIIIEVNRFSYNYLTVAKIIDKNESLFMTVVCRMLKIKWKIRFFKNMFYFYTLYAISCNAMFNLFQPVKFQNIMSF